MYLYEVTEGTVYDAENRAHTAYGLRVCDGRGGVIRAFDCVFTDRERAEAMVSLCNEGMLSDVHLEGVIEDALI